jgi:acyl-CoA thioester hydrolase
MVKSEIRSILEIHVQFHETDMLGIVHNAVYFQWFERGRMTILDKIFSIDEAIKEGYSTLVIRNLCQYHSPARFKDILILTSRLIWNERYEGKIQFTHEISNKKTRECVADGETSLTLINLINYRLIKEIPEKIICRLKELANTTIKEIP